MKSSDGFGIPPDDYEEELVSHLQELVRRLRRIFAAILLASAFWAFAPGSFLDGKFTLKDYEPMCVRLIKELKSYMLSRKLDLYVTDFSAIFWAYVAVSLIFGILTVVPFIAREIYLFVERALFEEEKAYFKWFVVSFCLLFYAGAFIAFVVILPITYGVLIDLVYYADVMPIYTLDSFLTFLFIAVIGIGLAFTFPVFLTMLVLAGVFTTDDLRKRSREFIFVLSVVTAVVTPDPSGITMMILLVPMIIEYYATISIAKRIERKESLRKTKELAKKILVKEALYAVKSRGKREKGVTAT